MATVIVPQSEGHNAGPPFLHVKNDDVVRIGHVRHVRCPFCHQPHVKLQPGDVPEGIYTCPTCMDNYKIVAMYDITL